MADSEEVLKSLLMRVKEEREKAGLKLVQKTKTLVSAPITSWQKEEEKVEAMTDFRFLGSKVTTVAMKLNGFCSLEGKLWQT